MVKEIMAGIATQRMSPPGWDFIEPTDRTFMKVRLVPCHFLYRSFVYFHRRLLAFLSVPAVKRFRIIDMVTLHLQRTDS